MWIGKKRFNHLMCKIRDNQYEIRKMKDHETHKAWARSRTIDKILERLSKLEDEMKRFEPAEPTRDEKAQILLQVIDDAINEMKGLVIEDVDR